MIDSFLHLRYIMLYSSAQLIQKMLTNLFRNFKRITDQCQHNFCSFHSFIFKYQGLILFPSLQQTDFTNFQSSLMNNIQNLRYRKNSRLRNLLQQLQDQAQSKTNGKKAGPIPNQLNPQLQRMNVKLTKSWKAPGTKGQQFGKINVLRNQMLSNWEIQRMSLSKRSYSCPKNFKGLKLDMNSREFGMKNNQFMYSKEFNQYLKVIEEKYQDNLFRPNYHQKLTLQEKKKRMSSERFKFTTTSNFFGAQEKKLSSLKSFKSQTLKSSWRFN